MSKANEPAYPTTKYLGYPQTQQYEPIPGFTKREAYALAAMQGLLASGIAADGRFHPVAVAELAFEHADAMLKESEKPHD